LYYFFKPFGLFKLDFRFINCISVFTSKGDREDGRHMSQNNESGEGKKYRIDIGAYGSIGVEAPTKEECLELFKEVTKTRRDSKLDEAIR